MKDLAILGASGHGKVVADIAEVCGWESVFFFDDSWPEVSSNGVWKVIGDTNKLMKSLSAYDGVIVAIGDCFIRWKKMQSISAAGGKFVTIIHPNAVISSSASIGNGSVVMAGAIVNADANIGHACIINSGSIVEHDCNLGDAVHIAPGAVLSGNVKVGSSSWVGVGAVVRQGISIGANATVGAGAVVVKPVENNDTVIGCPAHSMKK